MDVIRIAARRKSIGGNHRDEYRFLGACFPDEGLPSVADAVVLFFCYDVRSVGVFHLTEIDGVVVSVDEHIDLCSLGQRLAGVRVFRSLVRPGVDAAHNG